jgi:hypothetical protein
MNTHPTIERSHVPGPDERAALNAALRTHGTETGFWDDHGVPAPWPDDIDDWTPLIHPPTTPEPGHQPF